MTQQTTDQQSDYEKGLEQWLEGEALKSDEHYNAIKRITKRLFYPSNGHLAPAAPQADAVLTELPVFCTSVEDLYIKTLHPFVDVFNLIPAFEKLAYTPHGNLILKGPKGDGKSLAVRTHSFNAKVPLVVVECSENTKDTSLLGSFVLVGKQTVYNLGPIPKAIKTANEVGKCTLLFEEFNALTPQAQKMLNGVAQERQIEVPAIGKTYRLNDNCQVWIVGTMNPSVYGGTYEVNEDLKSRFGEIEIGYAPHANELRILKKVCGSLVQDQVLDQLIKLAKESRQNATGYALSTRDLVRTVHTIAELGLQTAIQMLICKFEGEDRDTAIKRANAIFVGLQLKKTWGEL